LTVKSSGLLFWGLLLIIVQRITQTKIVQDPRPHGSDFENDLVDWQIFTLDRDIIFFITIRIIANCNLDPEYFNKPFNGETHIFFPLISRVLLKRFSSMRTS
jgi:hypothetical protein